MPASIESRINPEDGGNEREFKTAVDFDDLYEILREEAKVTERFGGGYGIEKIISFIQDVRDSFNEGIQTNNKELVEDILQNKSFLLHGIGTIRGLREKVIDMLKSSVNKDE